MKIHSPRILLHTANSLHVGDAFYVYPSKRCIPYGVAFLLICIAILWLYDLSKRRFFGLNCRKKSIILLYCTFNMLLILGATTLIGYTKYQNSVPQKPIVIVTQEGVWYQDVMYAWQQVSEFSTIYTTWYINGVKTKSKDTALVFKVKSDKIDGQKEQELKELKIDTGEIGADFDDFKTIFSNRYLHQK